MTCPLCSDSTTDEGVRGQDERTYLLCRKCLLIFVHPSQLPSSQEEKDRYDTHNNSIHNEGYVRFLNRIIQPMLGYLEPGMRGLDYGSGPGPVLSELVAREGLLCDNYDPIYAPSQSTGPYDFVFSTETFEHFHRPARDLEVITSLLRPGGYLGVMTELWTSLEAFAKWSYTRDHTHVTFFNQRTFDVIAERFSFRIRWSDGTRAFIFQKE